MKLPSLSQRAAWLLYDPANAAFALVVRTMFAPLLFKFCSDGILKPDTATSLWGYAASAAGIAAGIISVSCGAAADRRGRRKLAMLTATAAGVVTTVLLGLTPHGSLFQLLACAFLSLGAYMVANSFYDSLLVDVAKPEERHRLSVTAYACGYAGGIIPFVCCLILFKTGLSLQTVMRYAFFIAAVWWGIGTLPLLFKVKEKHHRQAAGTMGWAASWRLLRQNPDILTFLIAYFLYIDGVGTIYLMAAPIAIDIGISTPVLMGVILALQFQAFPCTLLYGWLSKRMDARKLVYTAIGVYILIAATVGILPLISAPAWKTGIFFAAAALIGTSQGGIQSLSRSLFSQLVPPEHASELFGVYNFFGKFTTILGPAAVGIAVWLWGRSEWGITLMILPFAAGAWMLSRVKFPD